MKTYVFATLLLCITAFPFSGNGQSFDWIKKIGDSGNDCPGQIASDSSGNLYVAGSFVGQLVFGSDTIHSTSSQYASMFLAKFDANGTALWGKKLPVSNTAITDCGEVNFTKIKISASGKIYVMGYINYNGTVSGLLSVYRASGAFIGYQPAPNEQHQDIDIDSVDNGYIVGTVSGGTFNTMYYLRFDSSLNLKWAYYSPTENAGFNIKYIRGAVYITGQFHGQVQLADTQGTAPISLSASGGLNDWDFFMATYTRSGKLLTGIRSDGLTSAVNGIFSIGSEFTIANHWRIGAVATGNYGYTKEYSLSLAVIDSMPVIPHFTCSFSPTAYVKTSRFTDESSFNYYGFLCIPTIGYHLDSVGHTKDVRPIPFATGSPQYMPSRDFSFDRYGKEYVTSGFQGTIVFYDSLGKDSLISLQGSPDIYVGKYHQCTPRNATIIQSGDTLQCSISGAQYQWLRNNVVIAAETNQQYISTVSGSYSVQLQDSWKCTDTSAALAFVYSPTGVQQTVRASGIWVYPNPTSRNITIDFGRANTCATVTITSVVGQQIFSEKCVGFRQTIVAINAPSGFYLVTITLADGTTEKFKVCKTN